MFVSEVLRDPWIAVKNHKAMGCAGSKFGEPEVPEVRRCLSLGHVGPPEKDDKKDDLREMIESSRNEDRSLLMTLSKEQVLHMVEGDHNHNTMGRVFSIGSNTDKQMEKVASFSSKTVKLQGEKFETHKDGIGFACKKGMKPESPNQDSFFILKVEQEYSLYGVFDGHGRKGHDVSNFVKDHLPKVLLMDPDLSTDPLKALGRAFDKTQKLIVQATELQKLDATRSGSTCSVIFNDHRTNTLHVAHVGDSRCVLARAADPDEKPASQKSKKFNAVDLTIDHKPSLPEERARIEAAGGRVVHDGGWNHRVYAKGHKGPGLNMSRAMGDLVGYFHAGISASPDVTSHVITPDAINPKMGHSTTVTSKPSLASYKLNPTDKFILLCSDGVWEFMSSEEVVNLAGHYDIGDAMKAAERLATVAWDRWMKNMKGQVVDDITAVLVNLEAGINAAANLGDISATPSLVLS